MVYTTSNADFYFEKDEFLNFYEENRFEKAFEHLKSFLIEFDDQKVIMPDTMARVQLGDGDSMRDDAHRYSRIQDDLGWTIIEFARAGNIKIYSHVTNEFLSEITFFKKEDQLAGTSGLSQNDVVLVEELRWIK